jgi:hypothetical protein
LQASTLLDLDDTVISTSIYGIYLSKCSSLLG